MTLGRIFELSTARSLVKSPQCIFCSRANAWDSGERMQGDKEDKEEGKEDGEDEEEEEDGPVLFWI